MRKVCIFKQICECDKVDIRRIFPTKQKIVKKIHEEFDGDQRIACVMVFGSAVTNRCHQGSDIDLLVRLNDGEVTVENKNDISERIQELSDWNADIIWYDRISKEDRIYQKILEGVQIV